MPIECPYGKIYGGNAPVYDTHSIDNYFIYIHIISIFEYAMFSLITSYMYVWGEGVGKAIINTYFDRPR